MFNIQTQPVIPGHERRRHPRYPITSRVSLAVEDISIGEQIGIGEAVDISQGGLRVRHLPKSTEVRAGDRLGLLVMDEEHAVSLRGEVVHHGTTDSFGVEFRDLTQTDRSKVELLVRRFNL